MGNKFPFLKSIGEIAVIYYTAIISIILFPSILSSIALVVFTLLFDITNLSIIQQCLVLAVIVFFFIYTLYLVYSKLERISSGYRLLYWISFIIYLIILFVSKNKLIEIFDHNRQILINEIPGYILFSGLFYLTTILVCFIKKPKY